jgi:phospholipid/cholesterol/gamma-HCH transport system ATP-binding protein
VVNLGGLPKLMPSQLSGGMIKRAALARAIVMIQSIVLMNLSAGLDPVVASEIDDFNIKIT